MGSCFLISPPNRVKQSYSIQNQTRLMLKVFLVITMARQTWQVLLCLMKGTITTGKKHIFPKFTLLTNRSRFAIRSKCAIGNTKNSQVLLTFRASDGFFIHDARNLLFGNRKRKFTCNNSCSKFFFSQFSPVIGICRQRIEQRMQSI